ncbi:MAG: hypothetical protein PUK59_01695 [Actinomycetaceae bacterium]|nr:hypothetical protein [Actinomycetaceae bacterium]MDY5854097.1 hypothetical protein [Arcanobacterium sp.]
MLAIGELVVGCGWPLGDADGTADGLAMPSLWYCQLTILVSWVIGGVITQGMVSSPQAKLKLTAHVKRLLTSGCRPIINRQQSCDVGLLAVASASRAAIGGLALLIGVVLSIALLY